MEFHISRGLLSISRESTSTSHLAPFSSRFRTLFSVLERIVPVFEKLERYVVFDYSTQAADALAWLHARRPGNRAHVLHTCAVDGAKLGCTGHNPAIVIDAGVWRSNTIPYCL